MAKFIILGNQARAMANFWTVLIKLAKDAGHDVLCLVPPNEPQAESELKKNGVRIKNYPLDRKGLNPLNDVKTLQALYTIFREEKPDVVFSYTIKPVIYGGLAARFAKIKNRFAAITGLGYAFEADSGFKKIIQMLAVFLYQQALYGAGAIFFQNQDDKELFIAKNIVKKDDPLVLTKGTGVDIVRFAKSAPKNNNPIFLLVGRLLEAKGLYEYAEAAKSLKLKYPQARFLLLGPPEDGLGSVSLDIIEAWQREGAIEYLGQTTDVRPYVEVANIMVLPSWREGTPCSIMEGMSIGRASVVTDAPGCREVVQEGVNGFLVPLKNPEALAKAMERFIKEPELIETMGNAGRNIAETEFDATMVAKQMLANMNLL